MFLGHGGEVWGECGRSGYGLNEGLVVVVEETVGPECGLFVFMNILEEVQDALVSGLAGNDFVCPVGDGEERR